MAEISKSLESRVSEFAARTGQEIKKVRGEIATSNTAAEALTQRVAANEGAITNLQSEIAKKVELDDTTPSRRSTRLRMSRLRSRLPSSPSRMTSSAVPVKPTTP